MQGLYKSYDGGSILNHTKNSQKFSINNFRAMVKKYIESRKDTFELIYDDFKKTSMKQRKILSICDFCCEHGINTEDDFWLLMSHPNKEYMVLGKILVNHIKNFAQKLIVNDKNANYAMLVGKTYFPEEEEGNVITKPPKEEEKKKRDISIDELFVNDSTEDRIEKLKKLKENL